MFLCLYSNEFKPVNKFYIGVSTLSLRKPIQFVDINVLVCTQTHSFEHVLKQY